MSEFTPYSAVIGGLLIGIGAALLLVLNGRVAGVSGIVGGLLQRIRGDHGWRVAFVVGLVCGVALYSQLGAEVQFEMTASLPVLVVGGLITGAGVVFGNGCTSGHGVCGIGRLSPRSMAATLVFMLTAGVTVYVVRHLIGGS